MISPAGAQALADLPAALEPAAGLSVYLEVTATGGQIYVCGETDAGARGAWVFKAPDAVLFDAQNNPIGKHYAGPTWELADGTVIGTVKANAPAPEAGAIPWLLLDIKPNERTGVFSQAKGILRVSTHGGVAPAGAVARATRCACPTRRRICSLK